MKTAIQKLGKSLSAMVMPNIGAFIAWGFITALFIADGWLPNEQLASIQPYMLTYLLPVLIAATGGRMVGGDRGLVMGAIAVVGCIAGVGGTDGQPMLMAAMVMGPFSGWVIKKFDQMMDGHMPAGFEMLINNFSVGILGMIVAIFGYYLIGPFMTGVLAVLTAGVDVLVNKGLIPLVAIFIEPAKVLFLNNAINHGIFTPIGAEQAAETGKSIMYMLEANPGPGLGVLLAYWLFSKDKATKDSAPGAIIIHFLGGIHEIYFPYILMNPVVIIAPIVGNMCAIAFYSIFHIGLKGPSSPGSIIAFLSMAEKGSVLMTALGVVIAAGVSFLIASPIVKLAGAKDLNVHRFSSWILCALLYHICRKKPRDNSSSFRPYLLYHKPPLRLNEGRAISEREELPMKAFVDPDLCIGCTQCAGICPEVFQMTGILAAAVPGELPPDTVPTAVEAAQACPVSAITISE